MNHNIWKKIVCYDSLLQVPFCEDESVQLFRVAFFWIDFFQNPYFNYVVAGILKIISISEHADIM